MPRWRLSGQTHSRSAHSLRSPRGANKRYAVGGKWQLQSEVQPRLAVGKCRAYRGECRGDVEYITSQSDEPAPLDDAIKVEQFEDHAQSEVDRGEVVVVDENLEFGLVVDRDDVAIDVHILRSARGKRLVRCPVEGPTCSQAACSTSPISMSCSTASEDWTWPRAASRVTGGSRTTA